MTTTLPCGHPAAATHTADEGTRHCPACEAEAWDDDSPPPCCPSCGVPYVDHLGLWGTCAEVQQLRAILADALALLAGPDSHVSPEVIADLRERAGGARPSWPAPTPDPYTAAELAAAGERHP